MLKFPNKNITVISTFEDFMQIETVFSQLSEQLKAERVLAKSFQGLCTRLVNKILGYNLCLVLNSIFHETCELGKIKQLIFRGYFGLLQVFIKI